MVVPPNNIDKSKKSNLIWHALSLIKEKNNFMGLRNLLLIFNMHIFDMQE